MNDQDIKQAFDNAAKSILQFNEEISDLTVKFGSSSRITKSKQEQLIAFSKLYEVSAEEIQNRDKIIAHHRLQLKILDMMNFKSEAMITYTKIATIYGMSSPEFKKVDAAFNNFMIELTTLAIQTDDHE